MPDPAVVQSPGGIKPTHLVESSGPGSLVRTERDSVLVMGLDAWEQSEFGYEVIRHRFMEKVLGKSHMRMPISGACTVPCRQFPEWGVCSDPACAALQRRSGRGAIPCRICGTPTRPARFVAVCRRGHLGEFPWAEWAHGGRVCGDPSLREVAHGSRAGLAGYAVRCRCGASRTYAGATSSRALVDLGVACGGHSPWLGEARRECADCEDPSSVEGVSILARNLYVPRHLTAIRIPGSAATADGCSLDDVLGEEDIKRLEYACLMRFEGSDGDLEVAGSLPDPEIAGWVPALKTVGRLAEIRALHGFARGRDGACALSERADWCPAVINRGEGIFFSLDEGKLDGWAQSPEVAARCAVFGPGANGTPGVSPAYAMLHTLAHALIRELSAVAGYPEASIRERIYSGGALLYTASAQSDGGLGGLARQGEPGKFRRLLRGALQRSALCSRDPLCAENDPAALRARGARAMRNGSACYACMLLPETSCEARNELLDRKLLAGEAGFFAGMPGV